jgi:ribosomal protein S18 acetylase RimI-like enzyme
MNDGPLFVESLTALSDADADAIASLLAQLSTTAVFDAARIETMLDHDATDLVVARIDGKIIGMATLVAIPLPSGMRGHVEDVVVDGSMRGRGIARLLLETLTRRATERGLRTLDLTSRPIRAAALRLYESVGFTRRDTTVLRYEPPTRLP